MRSVLQIRLPKNLFRVRTGPRVVSLILRGLHDKYERRDVLCSGIGISLALMLIESRRS